MKSFFSLVLLTLFGHSAQANYLFVLNKSQSNNNPVCFLAKEPTIKSAIANEKLKEIQIRTSPDGQQWKEELSTFDEKSKTINLSAASKNAYQAFVKIGVVNRGEGKTALIQYAAGLGNEQIAICQSGQLQLIAVRQKGRLSFQVSHDDKPLPADQVLVAVYDESASSKWNAINLNNDGLSPSYQEPGRYVVRVIWSEAAEGEFDGRKYQRIQHYLTLTVELP